MPPEQAAKLAYYGAANGKGVLAPRGWICFGTYGSNGTNLYVSPEHLDSSVALNSKWKGFSGPAIQLSISFGDTSGRFEVARVIARAFPTHRDFVTHVIAEKIQPASDFPFGPFPKDEFVVRTREVVEFTTPANSEGLGTMSRLTANGSPIRGVAILTGQELTLTKLNMRLPPELESLSQVVIRQVEQEAEKGEQ